MMIVGICGCTALLVTGFGVRDSIKNVVSMQYDEIFHVDYEVTFNHGISEDEQEAFIASMPTVFCSSTRGRWMFARMDRSSPSIWWSAETHLR